MKLAELGINGPADVLAIEPCPETEPERGRVITGTFTTARCSVLELRLSNGEVLEPTPPHRFYSETRQDWVEARELRVSEQLRSKGGEKVTLASVAVRAGEHRVYNLEVEQEHQFYVGETGVLVHNSYAFEDFPDQPPSANVREAIGKLRDGQDISVETVEDARILLDRMPDLEPHTFENRMPVPPEEAGHSNPFWRQQDGTYRGDLINVEDPTGPIHPDLPEGHPHRDTPHYNIRFNDGTKATILITG